MKRNYIYYLTRRDFLKKLGKTTVFCTIASSYLPLSGKAEAASLSYGTARFYGTDNDPTSDIPQVLPRQCVTWVIEYTAGTEGIESYGKLRIQLKPFHESFMGGLQILWPTRKGYVTASTDGTCDLSINEYHSYIDVSVIGDPLIEGQKISVVLGDTSHGGEGFAVAANSGKSIPYPLYPAATLLPRVYCILVRPTNTSDFIQLDDPFLFYEITHGPLSCLDLMLPSVTALGETTRAVLRVTDEYGNLVEDFEGTVSLSSTDATAIYPSEVVFASEDRGLKILDNVIFNTEGIHTLYGTVLVDLVTGSSNPIECLQSIPMKHILWGDIHVHTQLSDGREIPDDGFNYARNISNLDFMGNSDHSYYPARAQWIEDMTKPKVEEYYEPGFFSTFFCFEYSKYAGHPEIHGHRNVYYRSTEGKVYPSYRGDYDHPDQLFSALQGQQAIVIPHHVSWINHPVDWSIHYPKLQRLIEIYSIHGLSEYQGNPRAIPYQVLGHNVQDGLALGHKLGIVCSSDSHLTKPGLKTKYDIKKLRPGIMAVYAEENTREAIWDAMYKRHCYGTTGERIILDFRINGRPMGSEIAQKPGTNPEIYVKVVGTNILQSVEIVKGHIGEGLPFPTIHVMEPGIEACEFAWEDDSPPSDCFYYVRVTQADEEMAWSSPIWVSPSMRIKRITRNPFNGNITIAWCCLPFRLYTVYYRDSMDAEWQIAQTDIPSNELGTLEWTDDGALTGVHPSSITRRFYSVEADG